MTGNSLIRRFYRGEILLELLVASGIFLIISTSVISLVMSGRTLVTDSLDAATATQYAKEGLEATRLLRDQSWDNLTDGNHGITKNGANWQFTGVSDSQNGYTRTINITSNTANSKFITSQVTWSAVPSRTPKIIISALLTNWKKTQEDNFLSGDWTNPVTAGTADVDNGAQGTDVLVENGIVYLSSSASLQNKPDLTIFNAADINNPIKLSSIDLGISNVTAITKSGNYVYAAISGATEEFIVVDVSNPSAPVKVKTVDISTGKALSIKAEGNRLYFGEEKINGESEFFVEDISNPLSPVLMGSFEVNGDVNAIDILNNRAYLATSVDNAELMVLDIADPAHITKLGQFDAASVENGTAIFVKDEFNVYLGRETSGSGKEFYVLDASNPSILIEKGSSDLDARVNDMVVVNHLAFLVTEQPNAEFRILEVADPTSISTYATPNFPENALGIAYENNVIFCAVRSNSALRILKSG